MNRVYRTFFGGRVPDTDNARRVGASQRLDGPGGRGGGQRS